jgi:lysophospholipase L1-like esterase
MATSIPLNRMRRIILLILLMSTSFGFTHTAEAFSPPAGSLIGDYKAGVGITSDSGSPDRISQWNDQSGNGYNLTQATSANEPYNAVDLSGNPVVRFQYLYPTHPNINMANSSMPLNNQTSSIFVIRSAYHTSQETLFTFTTWSSILGTFNTAPLGSPNLRASGRSYVTLHPPINKTLTGLVLGPTNWIGYTNTSVNGITIGSNAAGGELFSGDIYEILVYNSAVSQATVDAIRTYAVNQYGVQSTFSKQVVMVGDSNTEGSVITSNENYPRQAYPSDWQAFNNGLGGSKIYADWAGQPLATSTDVLYNGSLAKNVMVVMLGTNDINSSGHTAAQTFADLDRFIGDRKNAGWEVWVMTIPPLISTPETTREQYNALITNTANYTHVPSKIIDYTADPRIGITINNSTWGNGDNLHFNSNGAAVLAEYVYKALNGNVGPVSYAATGSATGPTNQNVNITLTSSGANGGRFMGEKITLSDNGAGGTFSSSTPTVGVASTTYTFQYQRPTAGTSSITFTNNGILNDASTFTFTASAPAPPVISSIASTTAPTSATVSWTTDTSSNSKVSYGTVSGTYTVATTSAALVTSHSLGLTGLTAGTRYYFVVVSADGSGNTSTSTESSLLTTTVAPVISSITSSTAPTTATVTWTTDTSSNSKVSYGTVSGTYTNATTSATLVTSHSLGLVGLSAATQYYYVVVSADGTGNTSTSSENTLTTTATPPPVISSIASSTALTSATVTWTTDTSSNSKVSYGTVSGTYTLATTSAALVTSHSLGLTGLTASTKYYFVVVSADGSGNTSTSSEKSLTTTTAPPVISSIASTTAPTSATVSWTTDTSSNSKVSYGTVSGTYTLATSSAASGTSHSLGLTGLSTATKYYFVVVSADGSGNISTSSENSLLTTAAPDVTPPVISSMASSTAVTTATVSWTTDENSTSKVSYGTSSGTYTNATSSALLVTSHSLGLTGLTAATQYFYVVVSGDASGNIATSSERTLLTTVAPDVTPPVISAIASTTASTGATVTWTTDENSTSKVSYGTVSGTYTNAVSSGSLVTSHSLGLTGLATSTKYYFVVVSADASGNIATSSENSLVTTGAILGPVISSISSGSPTTTTAPITWNTDTPTDSQVEYGTSVSYGSLTVLDSTLVTSHSVTLSNLAANTTYHFRVRSTDGLGTLSSSTDQTFATPVASRGGGGGGGGSSGGNSPVPTASSVPPTPVPVVGLSFTRSLTTGSTGIDVHTLQIFLNTHGFVIALTGPGSLGQETNYFGPATKRALAAYQAAHGISPAVGYFGPITMATITGGVVPVQITPSISVPIVTAPSTASVTANVSGNRTLQLGSTGNDVRQLQIFLNAHGFVVAATGPGSMGSESDYFGQATQNALAALQRAYHITPAEGVYGPKTRAVINAQQ